LEDDLLKKQVTNNLAYNLRDNVNSYWMQEDGTYVKEELNGEPPFNIHKEFYEVTKEIAASSKLF
jgi:polyphosphate kinase